jgi:solute carrier family 41
MAGYLLDIVQKWEVFNQLPALFVLIPIICNLKGNLEMIFSARLSTAANLGELDSIESRKTIVTGNLALLQVQSIILGLFSGLFTIFLGIISTGNWINLNDAMVILNTSLLCVTASSLILGAFMSVLIILSRYYQIDPANIGKTF